MVSALILVNSCCSHFSFVAAWKHDETSHSCSISKSFIQTGSASSCSNCDSTTIAYNTGSTQDKFYTVQLQLQVNACSSSKINNNQILAQLHFDDSNIFKQAVASGSSMHVQNFTGSFSSLSLSISPLAAHCSCVCYLNFIFSHCYSNSLLSLIVSLFFHYLTLFLIIALPNVLRSLSLALVSPLPIPLSALVMVPAPLQIRVPAPSSNTLVLHVPL